jgi:hypothetical protein
VNRLRPRGIAALVLGADHVARTLATRADAVQADHGKRDPSRLLEQYGSDAQNCAACLSAFPSSASVSRAKHGEAGAVERLKHSAHGRIQELKANTEAQHELQTRIISAAVQLAQSRLALFTQSHDSIPVPFLTFLIFWLAVIFASFGLFVRPVSIVVVTFVVGALSVSGALFLILELDQPFAGLFQISTETFSNALAPLGN